MTTGALLHLADTHEARSPGLAFVLREWADALDDDALGVAKAALVALAGAERLASLVPADAAHREAVAVLGKVMVGAARRVFAGDAVRTEQKGRSE